MCTCGAAQFGETEKAVIPIVLNYDLLRRPEFRDTFACALAFRTNQEDPVNIPQSCWEIILFLVEEYVSGKSAIVSDIRIQTGKSKSTTRRHLRCLKRHGVVNECVDPNDRRRHKICLAPDYLKVVNQYLLKCADDFKELVENYDKRERKKALDALKNHQRELAEKSVLLQTTLNSIDHGFAVWDHEHRLVAWNDKCLDFWYHPKDVHVGMTKLDLLRHLAAKGAFGSGNRDRLAEKRFQQIQTAGRISKEELKLLDGREVHVRRYPMPDNQHATVYTDVTAHNQLQRKLRTARDTMEKEVEERTRELKREIIERKRIETELRLIAKTLSENIDDDDFSILLGHLTTVVGADCAFIGKLSGATNDRIQIISSYGLENPKEQLEYSLAQTPCEDVLHHSSCICHSNAQTAFPNGTCLAKMKTVGCASISFLDSSGSTLGIMSILSKRPLRKPEEALTFLKIFATRVSNELQRNAAEKELKKAHDGLELQIIERTHSLTEQIAERCMIEAELLDRSERLQLMFSITKIANEADDINAAIADSLRQVCDYTTWPLGHVYVISPYDPDQLIPTNIWHMEDPEWFSTFRDITMKTSFKKGVGMPGRVLASGKPEWIDNVMKDDNFPRAKHGKDIVVKASFGFPVKVKNNVVAVMEFFSPFEQKVDHALLQAIEHVGTQLGRLHERVKAERELRVQKEKAHAANMAKSAFLSSMSHELRTPMNAILGFSQMLQYNPSEPLTESQNTYVNYIGSGGRHLLELINEVLDLAKIEAGKVELSLEKVDIKTTYLQCNTMMRSLADKRNIQLSVKDLTRKTRRVWADSTRLNQVLINLLSNAVKYNREGGKIILSLTDTADAMVRFSVTDTGYGIPKDKINKLFEPFSRLGAEATDIEGTGIGLTVTRELVELMKGRMGVESKVGNGSTFWFELPQVVKHERDKTRVRDGAKKKEPPPARKNTKTAKLKRKEDGKKPNLPPHPSPIKHQMTRYEKLRGIQKITSSKAVKRDLGNHGDRGHHVR